MGLFSRIGKASSSSLRLYHLTSPSFCDIPFILSSKTQSFHLFPLAMQNGGGEQVVLELFDDRHNLLWVKVIPLSSLAGQGWTPIGFPLALKKEGKYRLHIGLIRGNPMSYLDFYVRVLHG